VLAAFSGGQDSTALALLLAGLGYDVVLGHVDHGMRPGSAEDARLCEALAGQLGLPIRTVRLAVAPAGEAAAREARYPALEEMARAAGAAVLATGHTLDDDGETVLLRMGRGGFPLGIPSKRGRIVRPLLDLRRSETVALCAGVGIAVVEDPTNLDDRIARNRIRHTVLPRLGDEGVRALARAGRAARAAKQAQDDAARAVLAGLVEPGPDRVLRLQREGLEALAPRLQRSVLRHALASLGLEPTNRLVGDLARKVVPVAGARLDLPGGLAAWSEPEFFVAGVEVAGALPPVPVRREGRTRLEGWGIDVVVTEVAPPERPASGPWEALLDARSAAGPLVVRSRLPGDRYHPLGAPGSRKLSDVLIDAKVPRHDRDRVPLLTVGGRIAWVGGQRIDEAFKLTPSSTAALAIQVLGEAPTG